MPAQQPVACEAPVHVDNVVGFRLKILPRHEQILARWLAAGLPMGLSEASVYPPEEDGPATDFVLVWVRENTDPAYLIAPEGLRWVVNDYVRTRPLARLRSFEEALHFIRPVLADIVAA